MSGTPIVLPLRERYDTLKTSFPEGPDKEQRLENPADAVLSNRAVGAKAPGAVFSKTAFAEFAPTR